MKPIPIHSEILNETIYLSDVPISGRVCYGSKEIELLKIAEKNLGPKEYASYLKKIHLSKKTFPNSKIEDFKMEARQPEIIESGELQVLDAEQPVASTILEEENPWA